VAARREALEETGLEVRLVDGPNLVPFCEGELAPVQPFGLRAYEISPGHVHMDLIYFGFPVGGSLAYSEREATAIRWFSPEEIESGAVPTFQNVREWCRYFAKHVPEFLLSQLAKEERKDEK
jgi:8-oxo-dGTP pyrophosphatase MutT (NUDIX family)